MFVLFIPNSKLINISPLNVPDVFYQDPLIILRKRGDNVEKCSLYPISEKNTWICPLIQMCTTI